MPIQAVTLQLNIPEGYEPTGEIRRAEEHEPWTVANGALYTGPSHMPQIILRKKFTLPDWVKPGTWYAKDSNGLEFLYETKPIRCNGYWRNAKCVHINRDIMHDFPPAPSCDWKDSLIQKPETGV